MKKGKTNNNTVVKSSPIASAKVKRSAYLQELLDFYGGDYGTQKDSTELIIFLRENGYSGLAKFFENGQTEISN